MGTWKSKKQTQNTYYNITLFFVCKYRKKLLVSRQISDDIKQFSYEICQRHSVIIRYMEKISPNIYEKQFWKEHTFWTDGYFACSVGNVSEEMLKRYIENQGLRKRATVDVKGI